MDALGQPQAEDYGDIRNPPGKTVLAKNGS